MLNCSFRRDSQSFTPRWEENELQEEDRIKEEEEEGWRKKKKKWVVEEKGKKRFEGDVEKGCRRGTGRA
jgi:hypothetical protein